MKMELYRVLGNRKLLLIIIIVTSFNGMLFCREQFKGTSFDEIMRQKAYNQELLEKIDSFKSNKERIDYLNNINTDDDEEKIVINRTLKQIEYINGYRDKIKNIQSRAKQIEILEKIGNEEKRYTKENNKKSIKVYKKLEDVPLELGNDTTLISFFNYETWIKINVIIILSVLIALTSERDKTFKLIVYSSSRGRFAMAVKKGLVLLLLTGVITIINSGMILGICVFLYGGDLKLGRSIQSVSYFSDFVGKISIGKFLVIYIGTCIIVSFFISLVVWLLVLLAKNIETAVLFCTLIGIVEYLCFENVLIQSKYNVLKYINIFGFLNIKGYLYDYYNLNICDHAINLAQIVYIGIFFLTAVLGLVNVLLYHFRYPCGGRNGIVRSIFEKISDYFRKIQKKIGFLGMEIYKILFFQKGYLIVGVMILISLNMYSQKRIEYTNAEKFANDIYKEFEGIPDKKLYVYIQNKHKEIERAEENYQRMIAKYKKGEVAQDKLYAAEMKCDHYAEVEEGLSIIEERLQKIEKYTNRTGRKVWLLNDIGYRKLLGISNQTQVKEVTLILLFMIILLFSGNYNYEKNNNMYLLLRGTSKGRCGLVIRKGIAASVVTALSVSVVYGIRIYYYAIQYGLSGMKAPIQSIRGLESINLTLNIREYLIISAVMTILFCVIISQIVLVASIGFSQMTVIVVSIIVLIGPIIGEILKGEWFQKGSLFSVMYFSQTLRCNEVISIIVLKTIILLFIFVDLGSINIKKWIVTKERKKE